MIDPAVKQSISDLLSAAEERFQLPFQDGRVSMTGFELEAVSLLGRAEVMIAKVVDVDPVAYVELQQRVERIWADYVEKSNFAGLGACAALLYPSGRNG